MNHSFLGKRKHLPLCPWMKSEDDKDHNVTSVAGNGRKDRLSKVDNMLYEKVERYRYRCSICEKSTISDPNDPSLSVPDPQKTGNWSQIKPVWTHVFPEEIVVLQRKDIAARSGLKVSKAPSQVGNMISSSNDFFSQLCFYWETVKMLSSPPSQEDIAYFFSIHTDLTPLYGRLIISALQEIQDSAYNNFESSSGISMHPVQQDVSLPTLSESSDICFDES